MTAVVFSGNSVGSLGFEPRLSCVPELMGPEEPECLSGGLLDLSSSAFSVRLAPHFDHHYSGGLRPCQQLFHLSSPHPESNRGPAAYKAAALPAEL